jgi:hypothetical protein
MIPDNLVEQAKQLIQRNPGTRLDWAHANTEARTLMLMQKVYDIGFDNGYEHRKKVEASNMKA